MYFLLTCQGQNVKGSRPGHVVAEQMGMWSHEPWRAASITGSATSHREIVFSRRPCRTLSFVPPLPLVIETICWIRFDRMHFGS